MSIVYILQTNEEADHEWVDLTAIRNRYEGVDFNQIEIRQKSILNGLMEYSRDQDIDLILAPSRKKRICLPSIF